MHRRARARCLSGGASCATLRVITGTCIYALMYLLAAIVAEQCNTSDAWQGCKAPCHPRSGCVAGCRPGAAGRCGGARSQLPARAGARAAALTLLRGAAALHHGMSPGPDAHSAGGSAPAEWCWVLPVLLNNNNIRQCRPYNRQCRPYMFCQTQAANTDHQSWERTCHNAERASDLTRRHRLLDDP